MNLKYLLIFAVAPLLTISCQKTEEYKPPPGSNTYVPMGVGIPNNLAWGHGYKVGTYLIYRDSVTGIKDTISVISNTFGHVIWDKYDYTIDTIGFLQSIDDTSGSKTSNWKLTATGDFITLDYTPSTRHEFWNYPWTVDSLYVRGKKYGIAKADANASGQDVFYICDTVGFVKMRIFNGVNTKYVWELEEYHIVR